MGTVVVGVLTFTLLIPESRSLKEKRKVLRSFKDRLRSRFNVSVSETGSQNLWQRAEIGVALAAGDRGFAEKALREILDQVDSWRLAEVIDVQMEIL
ncbi:MAG: DUF503 domain-containing protein [Proteobacteria bacterium]|nr:DUF503 domain-containing protein [Pseudomonadota bacterium]